MTTLEKVMLRNKSNEVVVITQAENAQLMKDFEPLYHHPLPDDFVPLTTDPRFRRVVIVSD